MSRVVLFKTPGPSSSADPYRDIFEAAGYSIRYVPVLQEQFQLEPLLRVLGEVGDAVDWAGVVITSKRGAEAWMRAARASSTRQLHTDWSKTQLFAVGSSSLELLDTGLPDLPERARLAIESAIQAKSATSMLPLLLAHSPGQPESKSESDRPYLLIRGDKTTNELQDGLSTAGRRYREIVAYTTSARPELRDALHDMKGDWLVFFSPSSAEMVRSLAPDLHGKIAAIGETTATYLRISGCLADAVADEPTAEGLLRAIQRSDGQQGTSK